ncbi:hypothetical protein C8Q79DRAFT_966767 [Trametes meyenii]|nr:hypothetical protein C8Q79DRAFT_966767 [Trametes meyenii]
MAPPELRPDVGISPPADPEDVRGPDPASGPAAPAGTGNTPGPAWARERRDHTSLPPELWLEIFRYATHVARARTIAPPDAFAPERPADYAWGVNSPTQSMRTKCTLVRVCRAWRALATELLYEHVVVSGTRRMQLFCRTLVESREVERKLKEAGEGGAEPPLGHGRWVRHLEAHLFKSVWVLQLADYWQCTVRAVSMCQRLRVFSCVWQTSLPRGLLAALEQYLPSTLQELYWEQDGVLIAANEPSILTSTSFLSKFSALRVLDLRKICVLDAHDSLQQGVKFATLTLPHVACLALPTCPLLLKFAAALEMPVLHYLILDASGAPRTVWAYWLSKELSGFLERHGTKLRTVELLPAATPSFRPGPVGISAFLSPTTCPNLDTLVFDCREKAIAPSTAALSQIDDRDAREAASRIYVAASTSSTGPATPPLEAAHPRLRRVGIRGTGVSRLYPNKPTQTQAHLNAFTGCRGLLPGLEVVRTLGFLVGTSTDPLAPDIFVWWTEKFEHVGVDLQDGEGVVWLLEEEPEKKGSKKSSEKVSRVDSAGGKKASMKMEVVITVPAPV